MRGKTRGEARDELVKSGVSGETLNKILPHKVLSETFKYCQSVVECHYEYTLVLFTILEFAYSSC